MTQPRQPKGPNSDRSRPARRPDHNFNHATANPIVKPKPDPQLSTPPFIPQIEPIQAEIPVLPAQLDYVIIAEIASTFGLRGAVKASILTDFPERFDRLTEVFLAPPGAPLDAPRTRYEVMSARVQNEKQVQLRFAGVTKIEQAEQLRGFTVAVPIADAVELPEGEYFIFQIIGLDVYTTTGENLGRVVNVESQVSNDLYVVRNPASPKDLLLPAIKDVVKKIDLEAGRITVELLDGLLDL